MPIFVKCGDCGKALKAPDALAGQKARCPDCGAMVVVPSAMKEIEASVDEQEADVSELADNDADFPEESVTARKPCPMCGGLIVAAAIKCRFCGETLQSSVRDRERQAASAVVDNQLTGADIAICVVCFPIGGIVGVVAIVTGQPTRGLKMIGLATVMPFLWGAIVSLFQ